MGTQLVVGFQDGSARVIEGPARELTRLRDRIVRAIDTRRRGILTHELTTEGVMLLPSTIRFLGRVEPRPAAPALSAG